MLDTELSVAVDEIESIEQQIIELEKKKDKKMGPLLEEMLKQQKPKITTLKGFVFHIRTKVAYSQLKLKRPAPQPIEKKVGDAEHE